MRRKVRSLDDTAKCYPHFISRVRPNAGSSAASITWASVRECPLEGF